MIHDLSSISNDFSFFTWNYFSTKTEIKKKFHRLLDILVKLKIWIIFFIKPEEVYLIVQCILSTINYKKKIYIGICECLYRRYVLLWNSKMFIKFVVFFFLKYILIYKTILFLFISFSTHKYINSLVSS